MATKVIVLGSEEKETNKKPIEFVGYLKVNFKFSKVGETEIEQPSKWENIELICKDYCDGFDLMLAYDDSDSRGDGTLYKGYFNDGIV
jgi:hypothetical protein